MRKKKNIVLIVCSCFIFIFGSFFFIGKNGKKKVSTPKSKYPYYIEKNKERYYNYKQTHFNYKDSDIITHVNLNLDYPFYTHTSKTPYLNKNYILINKYFFVDSNYVPSQLEEIQYCTKGNIYLVKEAKEAFEAMCSAIQKDNLKLRSISAYRSYIYQLNLYNKYLVHDTKKNVDTYSAKPGYSEHQSGLVVDVDDGITDFNNFESTDSFTWMEKNAYKYGFILRYPKNKEKITGYQYESWHYRYVGKKIASYIKKHNITFDEYYARFLIKEN